LNAKLEGQMQGLADDMKFIAKVKGEFVIRVEGGNET